jgi:hypothetical protein
LICCRLRNTREFLVQLLTCCLLQLLHGDIMTFICCRLQLFHGDTMTFICHRENPVYDPFYDGHNNPLDHIHNVTTPTSQLPLHNTREFIEFITCRQQPLHDMMAATTNLTTSLQRDHALFTTLTQMSRIRPTTPHPLLYDTDLTTYTLPDPPINPTPSTTPTRPHPQCEHSHVTTPT